MKRINRKKEKPNKKTGLFNMLLYAFAGKGLDEETASRRATHQVFMEGGNPEYYPRKHTVMNYATQNRIAKKRKKFGAKQSKN